MIAYPQYLQFSPHFAQLDIEKPEDRVRYLKLYDDLPQKIKDLLVSMVTAEKVMSIGQVYGLDEFDTEAVALAVRKIAVGEIFIGDAARFISNETELPYERAKTLVSSIANEVLAPALDDVKKIQSSKFSQQPQTDGSGTPTKPSQPDQVRNPNTIDLRNRQN